MQRKLTAATTLESLRREARRWLEALREGDPEARERFERASPKHTGAPVPRDVRHALAREHGFESWQELSLAVQQAAGTRTTAAYEQAARDFVDGYKGDAAALERLNRHYGRSFTFADLKAEIWRRDYAYRQRSSRVSENYFPIEEARIIIAQDAGFGSWEKLMGALAAGVPPQGAPYALDTRDNAIRPRRRMSAADWDELIGVMKERRVSALDASGLMTDEALERIAALDFVTSLSLGGSRELTDDGLLHLARMPQLEHLDLSEYPVSPKAHAREIQAGGREPRGITCALGSRCGSVLARVVWFSYGGEQGVFRASGNAIAGIVCLMALISTAGCGPAEDDEDNGDVATVAFEVSNQPRTTPAETSAPRDLTKLAAGSKVSLVITVTVRGRGIPTGGGLGLAVHHAASWKAFASPNPARIHVEGPAGVRLECEWKTRRQTNDWLGMEPLRYPYRRPPTPAHPDQHDRLYNHVVLATVRGRGLLPGEKVVFRVGTERNLVELPPFQDRLHEIRVLADEDGDGKYKSVRDAVRFDIVPDRPDHLAVYVPSVIRRGDEFPVKVVAEDRLNNPIDGWKSGLLLSLGGRPEAPFSGTLRCPDSFESRRLEVTVRAAEGDLRGTSNPALIVDADFPYRLYWGDLHGHTQYSDGLAESYEEYFRFGRDLAALDVCAASDHGMWGLRSNLDVVRSFNEPGKFVTFPSWEWGGSPVDAGDRNPVYASEEDVRPIQGRSLEELYSSMREAHGDSESPRVITGPHHFTYSHGKGGWPFETWNPEFERFVEVYSVHGMGDTLDNPRRLAGASIEKKYMQEGLAKGLRFAVIANSDTHDSHPGRSLFDTYREGGLTGFWATDLRREAVWDALVSRRTTAAVWNRPVIVFTVNGQWMGSDITTPDAPRLRYTVLARQSDFEVQLVRNGRIVREDRPVDGIVDVDWTDTEGPPSAWYLVRLTAPDERWAWSSPVWVTRR